MFPQPYYREKKTLSPQEIASIASQVNINLLPYFQKIGMNPCTMGFHYLRDATIEYLIAEVEVGITKVIYPNIADVRDTTAGAVERAMRHALKTVWEQGRLKGYDDGVFPVFEKKPSNKTFVVAITNTISRLTSLPFASEASISLDHIYDPSLDPYII